MQIVLSSVVMTMAVLLTGAKGSGPVPLEIATTKINCDGPGINISGVLKLTKDNKLLPGRSRNQKVRSGLMTEYEYKSARAEIHVIMDAQDAEAGKIEFDATPEGEGNSASETAPASATLREEGKIVNLDSKAAIDQFYLYGQPNSSEINITYKTNDDEIPKKTVRKELNCTLDTLTN